MSDERIENVCRIIYQRAMHDAFASAPADGALELTRRIFGRSALQEGRILHDGDLAIVGGRPVIVTRVGLPDPRLNFVVGQMLARVFLRAEPWWRELSETEQREAELLAAGWLVAPPEPFLLKYESVGFNLRALADAFVITQTSAALRIHETTGVGTIVVADAANDGGVEQKAHIHKRGPLSWLKEDAIRELARKRHPRSVKKVAIRDAPRRVALFAAAV